MTVRELITQLLNEDMDDEVVIEAQASYFENRVSIEGFTNMSGGKRKIILVPETPLTANHDIIP